MAGTGVRERLSIRIQSRPVTFISWSLSCFYNSLNESLWLIRKTLLQGKFNKGTEWEGFISPEYRAIWKLGRVGEGIQISESWSPWCRMVGEVPMVLELACESPFLAATARGPECHCPLNLKHKCPFWRQRLLLSQEGFLRFVFLIFDCWVFVAV